MISQINITNAGPLSGRELEFKRANLITGMNETGKTTLTDIITAGLSSGMKKVLDKNNFQKITGAGVNRFGGSSTWNFEIKGGVDLPADVDYNALSLLIVRSNRNAIQNKESAGIDSVGWWKATAREIISGSGGSSPLMNKIRDYTNPRRQFWSIIDRINSYREFLIAKKDELNRFEKSRNDGGRAEERLKDVIAAMESMRKVRSASEFKSMGLLYTELCEAIDKAGSLEKQSSGEDPAGLKKISAAWELRDKKLSDLATGISNLLVSIEKVSGEKNSLERSIAERKKNLADTAAAVQDPDLTVTESLRVEIASLENSRRGFDLSASDSRPVSVASALLIGASVISAAGLFFSMWALAAAAVFFSLGVIRLALDYRKNKKFQSELAERVRILDEQIRSADTALKIAEARESDAVKARAEMNSRLASIEKEISAETAQLNAAENLLADLLQKKESLERETSELLTLSRSDESRYISRTALASRTAAAENAAASLADAKAAVQKLSSRAAQLFETDNTAPSNLLAVLENRRRTVDHSLMHEVYSDEEYQKLVSEKDSLTGDSFDFQKNYSALKTAVLAGAAASYRNIKSGLPKEKESAKFYDRYIDELTCHMALNDLSSLDIIIDRAAEASAKISAMKQYSAILFEAAARIESKQDSLIDTVICGPHFPLYFSSMTGHSGVDFSIQNGADSVDFRVGEAAFRLEDLSTGALDQFYFAFRLSLLKMIFKAPSTIVLDDAFIHFDKERRARAVSILKEFTVAGWQFIYTAVDDGAIEAVFSGVFGEEINVIRLD